MALSLLGSSKSLTMRRCPIHPNCPSCIRVDYPVGLARRNDRPRVLHAWLTIKQPRERKVATNCYRWSLPPKHKIRASSEPPSQPPPLLESEAQSFTADHPPARHRALMVERGALEMDLGWLRWAPSNLPGDWEIHRTQSQLHFENTKKTDGLQAMLPTPCQ